MKIVFLDLDGVLNSQASERRSRSIAPRFFNDNPDPLHIKWLNLIIRKTGAKVVISSTWRNSADFVSIWRLLDIQGFVGTVIGATPITHDIRGEEIRCWITRYENCKDWRCKKEVHGAIESFVILDDDADMGNLSKHLVLTDSKKGLTRKDALKAIDILGEKTIGDNFNGPKKKAP